MRFEPIRVLLLLVSLLAAGLAWLWFDQHGQVRHLAWLAPAAIQPDIKMPAGMVKAGASSAAASYIHVLERPLFAPDRRPPPPPAPPAPPPPPDPLADVRVMGVFTGETAGILARIDGKMRRIKLNEKIGIWSLKSIDGREIAFAQGDQTRQFRLAYARLDAPIAQPVPAPVSNATHPGGVGMPMPTGTVAQRAQDETRDRMRRLNESRINSGLPPVNYP